MLDFKHHEIIPARVACDLYSSREAYHDNDSRKTEDSPVHTEEHRPQVRVACGRVQRTAPLTHCMLEPAQTAPKLGVASA